MTLREAIKVIDEETTAIYVGLMEIQDSIAYIEAAKNDIIGCAEQILSKKKQN